MYLIFDYSVSLYLLEITTENFQQNKKGEKKDTKGQTPLEVIKM